MILFKNNRDFSYKGDAVYNGIIDHQISHGNSQSYDLHDGKERNHLSGTPTKITTKVPINFWFIDKKVPIIGPMDGYRFY